MTKESEITTKKEKKQRRAKKIHRIVMTIEIGILILAVSLGVSWKLIMIYCCIPLLCSVVLSRYKKLVLGVSFMITAIIWIWSGVPENYTDWRPYIFDEMIDKIDAQNKLPDNENAASIYKEILTQYQNDKTLGTAYWDEQTRDSILHTFFKDTDYPKVTIWLKNHSELIQKLLTLKNYNKCWFSLKTRLKKDMFQNELDHTFKLKKYQLAFLLTASANNDINQGKLDSAIQKYQTIITIASHLQQQYSLNSYRKSIPIENMAYNQLIKLVTEVHGLEQDILNRIDSVIARNKHNLKLQSQQILKFHKLETKCFLSQMIYEINTKGKIRYSRFKYKTNRSLKRNLWLKEHLTAKQKKLNKLNAMKMWLFWPSDPNNLSVFIDKQYQAFLQKNQLDPISTLSVIRPYGLARISLNLLLSDVKMDQSFPRYTARYNHGARIAIAIQRYRNKFNKLPESLDKLQTFIKQNLLIDPVNNKPFVYKLTDSGFTLYSTGINCIDDNGANSYHDKTDDIVIWPDK